MNHSIVLKIRVLLNLNNPLGFFSVPNQSMTGQNAKSHGAVPPSTFGTRASSGFQPPPPPPSNAGVSDTRHPLTSPLLVHTNTDYIYSQSIRTSNEESVKSLTIHHSRSEHQNIFFNSFSHYLRSHDCVPANFKLTRESKIALKA